MKQDVQDQHPEHARGYWLLRPIYGISSKWTVLRLEKRGGATPLRDFNNQADAEGYMSRCEQAARQ